jgi:apolipoprotein N-acyltransferase
LIPEEKSTINKDGILVSIIQPASDPFLKYEGDYYYQIEDNLLSLVGMTSQDSKLVVIPEAELPYPINNERFDDFLRKTTISEKIIMGSWVYNENKLYNSIYSPKYEESYKKTHLVPFGEYIPFIHSLRGLISFFDLPMSNVSHGSKSQKNITILDGIKVSTPICFDITFPNTVRNMNKSSLLMINISNDTWFGNSIGPHYHLAVTRIRSIENNRWTIRSTNDGISAFISNKGTIVDYIDKGESTILEGKVHLIDDVSFYNKIGYLLTYIFLFIIVITTMIWSIWKKYIK